MNTTPPEPDPPPELRQVPARLSSGELGRQTASSIGRTAPPQTPAGINLTPAVLWQVFCRWWKWILPAGIVLATLAGGAVWYLWVPKYEAAALIKIQANAPFIAFDDKSSFQPDGDRYVQTQIELLRGPVVLAPVLGRREIASITEIKKQVDPLKYLQKELRLNQVGESELYRVSFISPSPQDAATVANTVVAEYLQMQDREEKQRSQMVIEVLEKERLERGLRVEQLRKRVVELAKELTGRDPFGQGVVTDVSAFSTASSLYQKLTEADVQVEVLKAEIQSLQNAPIIAADKATAAGLVDLEISNRSDIRQLEAQLAELDEIMAALQIKRRTKIGATWKDDPDYVRLQKRSTEKHAELESLKSKARSEYFALKQAEGEAEQQRRLAETLRELNSIITTQKTLTEKFDTHLQDLKSGGAQSAELEFAKAELEREQRVFELIAARKLALQTEMRAPARVSLMQSAGVPSIAMELIPIKQLLLACLAALVAPFGVALAHELIARRVTNAEQIRTELRVPVLGEVARFPTRVVSHKQQSLPVAKKRELYVYAESIDSLRTNLRLTENVGVPGSNRVVAVCSAASGEGKTSVATALAVSIAEASQQPTLIVDADLRDPDVHELLNVPREPGVAEVLSGLATAEEAIHQVGNTQAYVMPAGKCRVNPHHLLHGPAIENLLNTLRERFETIVVDTPPVLSASESLVYAVSADLVIFCSLADVSRFKPVQMAVERLKTTGANLAGAVLNGVPTQRYAYHYGTYARPDSTQ